MNPKATITIFFYSILPVARSVHVPSNPKSRTLLPIISTHRRARLTVSFFTDGWHIKTLKGLLPSPHPNQVFPVYLVYTALRFELSGGTLICVVRHHVLPPFPNICIMHIPVNHLFKQNEKKTCPLPRRPDLTTLPLTD